ncbi:ATP-binding protein [Streptomyces erythrochromogenes]|uniref:ATP-binding protein n=1 Tax=Streptomyces erythrochromogenes TaxID=285574 RepID=UPI0003189236
MDHRLRFAPEILARLGEELVPHADLGIMELIRNAYDADATTCHIELKHASHPGGTLTVRDNGEGMTADQLASGFLLVGKSSKAASTHTTSLRRKVGEKGLGRIAALRLGTKVTVATRPARNPNQEHTLTIDWDLVDASDAVEDVPLAISTRVSDDSHAASPGTVITVTGLRQEIGARDAERLARSLSLLTGPFGDENAFRVTCDAPEFTALATLIKTDLLNQYEYRLVADLDEEGQVTATLYNWRGEAEFTGRHSEVARRRGSGRKDLEPINFSSPPASFELWMFNLNPSASRKEVRFAQQNTPEIKKWLREVGGIHLYHRELRVQPYGDRGNDWLQINLRRTSNPEKRPSTATSIGRIRVTDPDSVLRPKTDRSGFVETLEFHDLQLFAQCAMDWAADQRLDQREQQRVGATAKARDRAKEAETQFQNLMEHIAPSSGDVLPLDEPVDRSALESFASSASAVFATQKEEIEALREDLLLYRSLATVGTSTAVFAHEALRPASRIINLVKTVSRRVKKKVTSEEYSSEFNAPIETAIDSAKTLETFAKLPLSLLKKKKREIGDIEVDAACRSIVDVFQRYLGERSIEVIFDLNAEGCTVRTTVADIESIISNLLANSAHAFTRPDNPRSERIIRVRTHVQDEGGALGQQVVICVDDSGPGITGLPLNAIWLPGKTTLDNGTGLGLTIVRDIVADLKGTQEARAHAELGGARILVSLPAQQSEGVEP